MNLTNYDPLRAMSRLQEEINQLFRKGDWLPADVNSDGAATSQWMPRVDVKDDGDKYVIQADIPGVAPKDIEVSMENGVLSISGERKSESKDEDKGYRRIERSHGYFYRRFVLPDTADASKIDAHGKDGVLEIVIGKREADKARKIPIKG